MVIPKYPEIEMIYSIYSEFFRGVRIYNIVLKMKYPEKIGHLSKMRQEEIFSMIKTLFKMASLNVQSNSGSRDFVETYFV